MYVRVGDGGSELTHYFCPKCGTTVYYEAPAILPNLTAVDAGLFNDPDFPKPAMSIFAKRKYHCVPTLQGIKEFEAGPDEIPGV